MLEDETEFDEAAIFIEPPPVQEDTDEDSVDEDDSGTISMPICPKGKRNAFPGGTQTLT